jgi:5-methylcytosine-specific restriction endonuclease McrA
LNKPLFWDYELDYDEYKAYIESHEWDKLRNKRLLFDDFQCKLCGNRNNIQVHHLVYPIHGNYGTELLSDLITLCQSCHCLVDDLRKGQRVRLKRSYATNAQVWIRFADKTMMLKERDWIIENIKPRDKGFEVFLYDSETEKTCKFISDGCYYQISISDIVTLRERYGTDNVQIQIT